MNKDELLSSTVSVPEAAKILGISERACRENCVNGSLPASKLAINNREVWRVHLPSKKSDLISIDKAAEILGRSRTRIRQRIAEGSIKSIKIPDPNNGEGFRILVDKTSLTKNKTRAEHWSPPKGYLVPSAAAPLLGVVTSTVVDYCRMGKIPSKKHYGDYPAGFMYIIAEKDLKQAIKGKVKEKAPTKKKSKETTIYPQKVKSAKPALDFSAIAPLNQKFIDDESFEVDWYDIAKEHCLSPASLKTHLEKERGTYSPAGKWITKAAKEGIRFSELTTVFNTSKLSRAKEIILESFPGHFIIESTLPDGDTLLTPVKDRAQEYEWLSVDTSKRKFKYYVSKEENLMQIRFDDDLPGNKIVIEDLTDIHVGSKAFREEMFDAALQRIANDPMRFAVLGGDSIEAITKASVGDPAEQDSSLNEQMVIFVKKLMPIAHKLLAMEWGNHCGGRTEKSAQVDLARTMASMLKVPYFRVRVTIDLTFRGITRTISLAHKYGKALSSPAIVAQVHKLNSQLLFPIHCWFSGHTHQSFVFPFEALMRAGGSEPKLMPIRFYICNGGSFVKYTGTYAEREGYAREPQDIVYFEFDDKGSYTAGTIPMMSE